MISLAMLSVKAKDDAVRRLIEQDTQMLDGLTRKVKALEAALDVMAARNKHLDEENRRLRDAAGMSMVAHV